MKVKVSFGSIFITCKVGLQLIHKQYVGFSKKEAVKLFKTEYNLL